MSDDAYDETEKTWALYTGRSGELGIHRGIGLIPHGGDITDATFDSEGPTLCSANDVESFITDLRECAARVFGGG